MQVFEITGILRVKQCLKKNTFLMFRFVRYEYIGTPKIPNGTKNWFVETYRKKLGNITLLNVLYRSNIYLFVRSTKVWL